jgi:hypothetical protein
MDMVLWLLIQLGEALVGVLLTKLVEWLLRECLRHGKVERNSKSPKPPKNSGG